MSERGKKGLEDRFTTGRGRSVKNFPGSQGDALIGTRLTLTYEMSHRFRVRIFFCRGW